jgi:hypothetical protein
MLSTYQDALFYFIDKAFDYRTEQQHLYLACAYYMKELLCCSSNKAIERNKQLLFASVNEITSNAKPSNLEAIVEEQLYPVVL